MGLDGLDFRIRPVSWLNMQFQFLPNVLYTVNMGLLLDIMHNIN